VIAADSCSLVGYLNGEDVEDVELIQSAVENQMLLLPPVVLSELLSAPNLEESVAQALQQMPLVELPDEFWVKVGKIRRELLAEGKKARLADAMIAMSCIENELPLITRDRDFRHYGKFGLRVLPEV